MQNGVHFISGLPRSRSDPTLLAAIRRKAEWVERRTVLPPDLFARLANDAFWRVAEAAQRRIPIIHMDL